MSSSPTSASIAEVAMPQMGVSVAEGTVVEWKKRVGDWVEADETIVEISTDKVETEVPSPASGRVAEILVEVGTTVDVGALLARIDTAASDRVGATPRRTISRSRRRRTPGPPTSWARIATPPAGNPAGCVG